MNINQFGLALLTYILIAVLALFTRQTARSLDLDNERRGAQSIGELLSNVVASIFWPIALVRVVAGYILGLSGDDIKRGLIWSATIIFFLVVIYLAVFLLTLGQ